MALAVKSSAVAPVAKVGQVAKGGEVLEGVGRLLAPQATQSFLNAPLERQQRARLMSQGSAMDELAKILPDIMSGTQAPQTINVGGQDVAIPALKLSTQTMGPNGVPIGDAGASAMSGSIAPGSGMGKYLSGAPLRLAMQANPEAFVGALQNNLIDAPQNIKLSEGEVAGTYTRGGGFQEIARGLPKDQTDSTWKTALKIAGGDEMKAAALYDRWKKPASTTVNVGGGEKGVTTVDTGRYKQTVESLDALDAMAPYLDQMMVAMQNGAQTGLGQPQILEFKKAWKAITGEELAGTKEQEVFDSAASYLAPRMRVAGSGASSDRDLGLYLRSIPGLTKTQGGNIMIRDMFGQVRDYQAKVAEIQQDLLAKHDRIPIAEARKRIAALGPIFTPDQRKVLEAAAKAPAAKDAPTTAPATTDWTVEEVK